MPKDYVECVFCNELYPEKSSTGKMISEIGHCGCAVDADVERVVCPKCGVVYPKDCLAAQCIGVEGSCRCGDRPDLVNHPPHYKAGGAECIEVIEALGFNYAAGNAMKYLWRHKQKCNPIEDLQKCIFYLNREIERLKSE